MNITAPTDLSARPGLLERAADRIAGKTALVTGAGALKEEHASVGHAIAVLLAAAGAQVVVVDRDESAARHTVDVIRGLGHEATHAVADVRSPDECTRAVKAAISAYGKLDVLVNNAAILGAADTLEADDDLFRDTLEVNFLGALRMSRAATAEMSDGSSIVHITSLGAHRSFNKLSYETSKGALTTAVNTMAIQLGHRGVRVNGVCPGQVWTPMGRRRLVTLGFSESQINAHRRERAQGVPLRLEGTAWDVAAATLFLVSDDARWITGQVLTVDGGQSGVVGYMPIS